jgi:hypothetical protein
LCFGGASGSKEMFQSVRSVEQMPLGLGVDEKVVIGGGAQGLTHVK